MNIMIKHFKNIVKANLAFSKKFGSGRENAKLLNSMRHVQAEFHYNKSSSSPIWGPTMKPKDLLHYFGSQKPAHLKSQTYTNETSFQVSFKFPIERGTLFQRNSIKSHVVL